MKASLTGIYSNITAKKFSTIFLQFIPGKKCLCCYVSYGPFCIDCSSMDFAQISCKQLSFQNLYKDKKNFQMPKLFKQKVNKYLTLTYPRLAIPWWLIGKERTCQCRRLGFHPWVRQSPQRRKWQPSPVLSPGKPYGQRSLAGCSPMGWRELDMTQ